MNLVSRLLVSAGALALAAHPAFAVPQSAAPPLQLGIAAGTALDGSNAAKVNSAVQPGTDIGTNIVTPPGGTFGRAENLRATDVFNVKDDGAVCDGVSIDTLAFKKTIARLLSSTYGGVFFIPNADCLVDSNLPVALGPGQRFQIFAFGTHGAKVHFTNAASVGFQVTMAPTAKWLPFGPHVSADGVDFIADFSGVAGTALSVTQSDPTSSPTTYARNPAPAVSLRSITLQGSSGSSSFLVGVALNGINVSRTEDFDFEGATGDTTATAMSIDTDAAIPIAVDHQFYGFRTHYGAVGLDIGANSPAGSHIEGIDVYRPSIIGTATGFRVQNTSGTLGLYGGQIDATSYHVRMFNGVTGGLASHGVEYLQRAAKQISLDAAGFANLNGNDFLGNGSGVVAVTMNNMVNSNTNAYQIANNTFKNFSNAPISLTGTTDYVHVIGNTNRASSLLVNDTTGSAHNTVAANVRGGVLDVPTIGQPLVAGTPAMYGYSSGNANPDVQCTVSGGNTTNNQGTYKCIAGLFNFSGSMTLGADVEYAPVTQLTPLSSVTIPNFKSQYIYAPGSTTNSLAITLPATPRSGQRLEIALDNPVVSLTISANTGQSLAGPAVSGVNVPSGGSIAYYYMFSTWYYAGASFPLGEQAFPAAEDHAVSTATASFPFDATMFSRKCKATSAACVGTLPACTAALHGRSYELKSDPASTQPVSFGVTSGSGDLIDGAATYQLAGAKASNLVRCNEVGVWDVH